MTTSVIKLEDLELRQKRVLVREDLNVPLDNGKITSDVRIRAAVPTLQYLLGQNARLMVMSHLGRRRGCTHRRATAEIGRAHV